MAANAAIYIPIEKIDLSDLFTEVKTDGGLFKKPSYYEVNLDGDIVRFNVMEKAQILTHINGLLGYIASLGHDDERKADTSNAIKYSKIILGLKTKKEFKENHEIWQSLFTIADKYDGFVFAHDSVLLPNGAVLVGPLLEADT